MLEMEEQKDYMGVIRWGRLQCGAPQALFASEVRTDHPIYLEIHRAAVYRDLCDMTVMPDAKPYITVELTPVQWAEFLTAGNNGEGVPCTITRVDGKRMSPVEPRNLAKEYETDLNVAFNKFSSGLQRIEDELQTAIDSGKPLSKTRMQELKRSLCNVRNNSVSTVEFVRDRFKEDMAKVVMKAKAEVNAYAERQLIGKGVQCLIGDAESTDGEGLHGAP